LIFTIFAAMIAAAGGLARRHINTSRADRRAAWRVTSYLAIAGILSWVLRANHSSRLEGEIGLFFRSAGIIALLAAVFWTLYMAVERTCDGSGQMRSLGGRVCSPDIFAIRASAAITDRNGPRRRPHSGRCGAKRQSSRRLASLAMLVSLALFGFYASRAGQPLFGSILGDEGLQRPTNV
jgi:hypothetical protein